MAIATGTSCCEPLGTGSGLIALLIIIIIINSLFLSLSDFVVVDVEAMLEIQH